MISSNCKYSLHHSSVPPDNIYYRYIIYSIYSTKPWHTEPASPLYFSTKWTLQIFSDHLSRSKSHQNTLKMQTLTLSLSSLGQPVIINHYSTLTIPNTSRWEKTQVSTIYYLPNFPPLDISVSAGLSVIALIK